MKRLAPNLGLFALAIIAAALFTREYWLPLANDMLGGGQSQSTQVKSGSGEEIDSEDTAGQPANALQLITSKSGSAEKTSGAGNGEKAADTKNKGAQGGEGAAKGGEGKGGKEAAKESRPAEKKPDPPKKKLPEPPPAVESEEGKQLNADLDGYLINVEPARIKGFAFDSKEREAEVHVEIYIDEAKAFELKCSTREENKQHGIIWHYEREKPEALQDGEQHRVRAYAFRKDKPGRKELRWSPRDMKKNNYPTGKLEEVSPEKGITGYAWDPDDSKTPIRVWLKIDGNLMQEQLANVENALLAERKIAPHAKCAFKFSWPAELDDGREHTVQVMAIERDEGEATGKQIELPGSPRVIADRGGVANKPPVGAFDICNKVVLAGWAWDEDAPSSAAQVEIHIDDSLFMTIAANSQRDGLYWSKMTPDPYHGWTLATPGILLDNKTHTIRVYALNTPAGVKVELQGSPKTYRQEENSAPMGGFWYADETSLRGWAADPDLGTAACEIEIYIDGKIWTRLKADVPEGGLAGAGYAPNPEHGFRVTPPETIRDGKTHDVTIYAINSPQGPPTSLGTRTIGKNSIIAGFWVQDKLLDTRCEKGLYVTSVSPWFDAYHKDVKVGDVMLIYDGKTAGEAETTAAKFYEWLQTKKKDDVIRFKFWRNGTTYECDIKLGQTIGS